MRAPLTRAGVAVCLWGALGSCHGRAPGPDVVATSSMGDVRRSDLDAYILTLPEARRGPGQGEDTKVWRRSLIEEMLTARSLEAEGEKEHVLDTPEAKAWLQTQTDAMLVEQVESRRVNERVKVSDADVKAFYDSHPKEVSHSGQIRVRNIYRRVPRDATPAVREAARKEMQDLRQQIRQGANFEEMARTRSDSETAPQGGLIGRLNHGDLSRSVEAIVWKLKDGEVSEVVGTAVGFQLFKIDDHIAPFKMEFAEALPRLKKRLVREATTRTLKEQLGELVKASGAVYHPEAASDPAPEAVIYSLGSDRITRADWDKLFAAKTFPAQRDKPMREQIDELVGRRLRIWMAYDQKLDQEPANTAKIAELKHAGTVRLSRERRLKALLATEESELKAFQAANAPRFMTPRLQRLGLITLPFPPEGVDYTVYERLQAVADEVRSGKRSFADAARAVSSDFTASKGGDTGFVRLDALGEWAGPRSLARVQKLKQGEISEPLLMESYDRSLMTYHRDGYMLVMIQEVKEPHARPWDEVREDVTTEYISKNYAPTVARIRKDVLAEIHARIYDQNL
jgi:parvulin-like peptidyl-prolyl isomerase